MFGNRVYAVKWDYVIYGALVILNLGLGELNQQLGAGAVPIPVAWHWTVPVLSAMLTGLTMFLPKAGGPPQPPARG